MRYNQQSNYRRRKRSIRRIKVAVALIVAGLLCLVGWLFYDNFKSSNFNSDEQTTSAPTSSYIAPNIQIFRSPFFQFQADKSWSEDPENSTPNKYVYRSLRSGLLEHQLTVYVNAPPTDVAVTRVLVTQPNGDRGLKIVKVSEHCGKAYDYKDSSRPVTLDDVRFTCFSDDTRYTMLVGLAGGTTDISLPRPDGSSATYTILYSNVTASPTPNQLQDIMKSFQTR